MNPQPQPRIIPVLRHVQSLSVSAGPECSASLLSSLGQPPQTDSYLYDLALHLLRTAGNSNFANHQDLLNQIQNP